MKSSVEAVEAMMSRACSGVSSGLASSISATVPATKGAAIEVPML